MSSNDESLKVLRDTEKLYIQQKVELLEAFANAAANALDVDAIGALGERANEALGAFGKKANQYQYIVYTNNGGAEKLKVFDSSEASGCDSYIEFCWCDSFIRKGNHKFQLNVFGPGYDNDGEEVMMFDRLFKCGHLCSICDICRHEMKVYAGDEQIAYIKEPLFGGMLSPTLEIMDRDGSDETPMATVKANAICCIGGICCDHTFVVTDADGNEMGKIVKKRPESIAQVAKEIGTDADNFTMHVPKSLEPAKKGAMLAALHLVDYMLFEGEGDGSLDIINGNCQFKCCDLYCFGCILPCKIDCVGRDSEENMTKE